MAVMRPLWPGNGEGPHKGTQHHAQLKASA